MVGNVSVEVHIRSGLAEDVTSRSEVDDSFLVVVDGVGVSLRQGQKPDSGRLGRVADVLAGQNHGRQEGKQSGDKELHSGDVCDLDMETEEVVEYL